MFQEEIGNIYGLVMVFHNQQKNEKQEMVAGRLLSLRTFFFWSKDTKKMNQQRKEGEECF